MILSVSVRLHPLPAGTVTALGSAEDPRMLGSAALALARAPLELEALDVAWSDGGRVAPRCSGGGPQARRRAAAIAELMRAAGLVAVEVVDEDDGRCGHASVPGSGPRRARSCASAAARASSRRCFEVTERSRRLARRPGGARNLLHRARPVAASQACGRRSQRMRVAVVLDLPAAFRATIDVWGSADDSALRLMRRVKQRFDPAGDLQSRRVRRRDLMSRPVTARRSTRRRCAPGSTTASTAGSAWTAARATCSRRARRTRRAAGSC